MLPLFVETIALLVTVPARYSTILEAQYPAFQFFTVLAAHRSVRPDTRGTCGLP